MPSAGGPCADPGGTSDLLGLDKGLGASGSELLALGSIVPQEEEYIRVESPFERRAKAVDEVWRGMWDPDRYESIMNNLTEENQMWMSVIKLYLVNLSEQYAEELGTLGRPDDMLMKPAVDRLCGLFTGEIVPLLLEGSPHGQGTNSARAQEAKRSTGSACLEAVNECLAADRPQEHFHKTAFSLVEAGLQVPLILYRKQLITAHEVGAFFSTEGVVKAVGKQLVDVYGEEYPHFTRFVNFKPDMQFLKHDLRTVTMHWWLNMLDTPTEGRILYRSMQALFSKMGLREDSQDGISSATWARFRSDEFMDEFRWKGTVPSSAVGNSDSMIPYLLNLFTQASRTHDVPEFLAGFWVVRFVLRYHAGNMREALFKADAELKLQYEATETLLGLHAILNRACAQQWWFQWDQKTVLVQNAERIQNFRLPTGKREAQKYLESLASLKSLLGELEVEEGLVHRSGIAALLGRFQEKEATSLVLNDWLQPVEYTTVKTMLPVLKTSRREIFKELIRVLSYRFTHSFK
ncbi:hypothetical protein PtB15_12B344 [Puccinia triticina]|nr:hypothetical protein PtB15_12B344 [Puccinia triticina]